MKTAPVAALRAEPVVTVDPSSGGSRGGMGLLVLLAFGAVGLVLLLGLVGLVVAGGTLTGSTPPPPKPVVAPAPAPVPPPPPPAPVEIPPAEVAFVTLPEGASLYENDLLVCVAPCVVKHPSHAPLPRQFVVKADGYVDQVFDMTEATGPFLVELARIRSAPVPRPTAPTPDPAPQTPRPSIGRDRGKDGG